MSISKFCLIPAKAASKRLPRKNILPLRGRPMIQYVIETALRSGLFRKEDIWVSTESQEVASAAASAGARVHMRPEYLAHDPYKISDVVMEFLNSHPEYQKSEVIFILQANSPLTRPEDLREAYALFQDRNPNALFSVTEFEHPAFRAVLVEEGFLQPLMPEKIKYRTQELPPTYYINGAVTIVKTERFLEAGTYFISPIAAYIMPRERGLDIDTPFDYRLARLLMEGEDPQNE